MIQRYVANVFESLAFVFFLILVWSAVLGLAHPPAWNSFVAYYNSYGTNMARNVSITGFFGQAIPIFQRLWVPDVIAFQNLSGATADGGDLIAVFSFIVNILTGGVLSVVVGIGVLLWFVFYFAVNVLPVASAFVYFFSGDLVANELPGIVSRIPWQSLEGAIENGFPDPVPSWSFDPSVILG